MRSFKLLCEFGKFCFDNPDLRFWQALRAWSGYDKIITLENRKEIYRAPQRRDTFYWEGKRHDG